MNLGGRKFGPNWWGSGGNNRPDAFSKYFVDHCRECNDSKEVQNNLKEIVVPTILWQGDRIRCMKSARTLQCKICIVERKEILSRFRNEKTKIMNAKNATSEKPSEQPRTGPRSI